MNLAYEIFGTFKDTFTASILYFFRLERKNTLEGLAICDFQTHEYLIPRQNL